MVDDKESYKVLQDRASKIVMCISLLGDPVKMKISIQ